MKSHIAVVAWTAANRVAKYQDYETAAEADAHVKRVQGDFPAAFATTSPGGGPGDWAVDPVGKTLSSDPEPPPPHMPSDIDVLRGLLIDKGIFTAVEWEMKKAELTT